MKLRQLTLGLVLIVSALTNFSAVAMAANQELDINKIEHGVAEHLKGLQTAAWGELDQIKSTVGSVIALELLYAIAQKNDAAGTKWWYGIKAWEFWATVSSVYALSRFAGKLYEIAEWQATYQEFRNQLLGMQQGQEFLGDLSDLEADFSG